MPRPERPLDPTAGELQQFAHDLRQLRKKAGSPGYRELARRAHYSVSTLAQAAQGDHLPTLAVTLAYVRACGHDTQDWEIRWRALAEQNSATLPSKDQDRPPYPGLAQHDEHDADRFFGRDRLIGRLVERLSRQRLVGVIGASGSGKSSMLRAGLLPALAKTEHPPRTIIVTPGHHPLHECAVRLAAETGQSPDLLAAEFAEHPHSLGLTLGSCAAVEFVLVVDQFEEVFTTCRDPQEAAAFVTALLAAAANSRCRTRVVLSLRSDFYGHLARYPSLLEALEDAQTLVGPMTVEELHQAITRPAIAAGCSVETTLVTRLVAESAGQPGVLPLVSHVLLETWRRRRGNALTLAGYEAAGGVELALSRTAEQAYLALDDEGRDVARRVFLRLIALEEGTWPTKRRVSRSELDTAAAVVDQLVQARLLTTDADRVEISHEALISSWPRLADWLAEDQTGLRTHRALTQASQLWDSLGRDPGSLYRGTRLDQALDWYATHPDILNPTERDFLHASRSERQREQATARGRARRMRQLVALLTVFLVLAVTATLYAGHTARTATEQRNAALSAKVAGQAVALRTANPALAAQLSLAAYRLMPTTEARSSLLSAFATPYATRITGHETRINAIAFRADGHVLATAGDDNTVRLWNTEDPHHPSQLAALPDQGTRVRTIAFGTSGGLLVSASGDTVRLWDTTNSQQPRELASLGHQGASVYAVALHPGGALLATAGEDRKARLWDIADLRQPRVVAELPGYGDAVSSVAFHSQKPILATGSWDGTVRLWDISDRPVEQVSLRPSSERVETVAFHPQGHTLVSAGVDRTVRLWDIAKVTSPIQTAALTAHSDSIFTAAFAPDGNTLATAGWDQDIRLWNTADPRVPTELAVLPGHTSSVYSVAFSPNGTALATGSWDHTVWLRDLHGTELVGHNDTVSSVSLTPDIAVTTSWDSTVRLWSIREARLLSTVIDHRAAVYTSAIHGSTLATAGEDRDVRLFAITDPRNPLRLGILDGHADPIRALAFSPNGRTLAVSSGNAVRLWDVRDPHRPIGIVSLTGHTATVRAVAFSPDGNLLASAGDDRTARLWDVTDPHRPTETAILADHTEAVRSVAFSPANWRVLATAGMDRTIQLWSITDPRRPTATFVSPPHSHAIRAVAFSPDGHLLASVGDDRTARLWDVTGRPTETAILTGHTKPIFATAFTPDGSALASASLDRTAVIWQLDPEQAAAKVCQAAAPAITHVEWEQYFPGLPFDPPCA